MEPVSLADRPVSSGWLPVRPIAKTGTASPATSSSTRPRTPAQIKHENPDSLTPHQRAVYEVVRDRGPLSPSEIHNQCSEEVGDPRTKRTVRTSLSKTEQCNPPEPKGVSRDRTYSLADATATSPIR